MQLLIVMLGKLLHLEELPRRAAPCGTSSILWCAALVSRREKLRLLQSIMSAASSHVDLFLDWGALGLA